MRKRESSDNMRIRNIKNADEIIKDKLVNSLKKEIVIQYGTNPISNEDYGKIIISKGCYNKIANKEYNCITLDYITNKYNLTYTLENDNTILFFKRA